MLIGCTVGQFQCESNNPRCIEEWRKCDRVKDCRDGEDERDCGCRDFEFQCRSDLKCIDNWRRCDRYYDCEDRSDEDDCEPEGCRLGEFACADGQQCIPERFRCDGRPNCRDGSDERDGCPSSGDHRLNLRTYPTEQTIKEGREVVFQCRDEGPLRARVEWSRGGGLPFPEGTRQFDGRLEMPNIQLSHTGTFVCRAVEHAGKEDSEVSVYLRVTPRKYSKDVVGKVKEDRNFFKDETGFLAAIT